MKQNLVNIVSILSSISRDIRSFAPYTNTQCTDFCCIHINSNRLEALPDEIVSMCNESSLVDCVNCPLYNKNRMKYLG